MFSTCESSDDVEGAISGIRTLRDLCKENVEEISSREPVIYGLLGAELRVEDISTSRGVIPIRRAYLRSSEYRVGWVLDNDYSSCMICDVKFSFNRRRHHCRACGCLVCSECSMSRATIVQLHGSYRFRVCDLCTARCSTLENWNISHNNHYNDVKTSHMVPVNEDSEVTAAEIIEVEALPMPLSPAEHEPTQQLPTPSNPETSLPAESSEVCPENRTPERISSGAQTPRTVTPISTPVRVPAASQSISPTTHDMASPAEPNTPSPPLAPHSITPSASPAQVSTDITSPDMTPVMSTPPPATPATPPISPLTPNSIETPVIRHQNSDTTPVTIPLYDETPDRTRSYSLDASPQPTKIPERRRSSWREYFGFKDVSSNVTASDQIHDTEKTEKRETTNDVDDDDGSTRPVVSFVSKDPVRRASLLQLMASQDTGGASVNSTQLNVDVIGWDEDEDPDGSESSKSFSESIYYDERLYKRSIDLRNSAAADIRYSEKLSALFPAVDAPADAISVDGAENITPAITDNKVSETTTVSPSPKKKWNKKKAKR